MLNEELIKKADKSYQEAEWKASIYFQSLSDLVSQKVYVSTIIADFQSWRQNHIFPHSFISFLTKRKIGSKTKNDLNFIHWLEYTGKLNNYLDRSVSYIFMRDLGKELDSPEVINRIQNVVQRIKKYIKHSSSKKIELMNVAGLYRWSQKEEIETTFIWLLNKLKAVSTHIPIGMNAEHAQRKLIKIIAGVLMNELDDFSNDFTPSERKQKLDKAIRIGYSYGLTYPFIDDLLDSEILSMGEKERYTELIRTTLITGSVPDLGEWPGKNKEFINFVHLELREAFLYIKAHQLEETRKHFFEYSYVFFHSQEIDRKKNLSDSQYTNEEIYIPIILKSSLSRLIVRTVLAKEDNHDSDSRTFYYGIYNQLADDFTDMFDDMKAGSVTPYTYYLKYHGKRKDLLNPFELYWAVIFNLIHHVYKSDEKTREIILSRAINGLKRFKERVGKKKYDEVMNLFTSEIPNLKSAIQIMVEKAEDVDFYDKWLRDQMISLLKNERTDREIFLNSIKEIQSQINSTLIIQKDKNRLLQNDLIVDAANYILSGDGKRLRPLIAAFMGTNVYGLKNAAIGPLLRSLEYMHTASLIFDDLPSQDNSAIRRGHPTLHTVYNVGIAELTGLFLTQKAIFEQTLLTHFDSKIVLQLIQYSAQTIQDMCKGQLMDLEAKGKSLSLEQMNLLCFYKTGKAFEASLLMPAILAQVNKIEMEALKKFAFHSGIAFQIKDDLLDVEGEPLLLGKPIGQDAENKQSTFVSILGKDEAMKVMWDHYCTAIEALQAVPQNTTFLKQLLNYFITRDH